MENKNGSGIFLGVVGVATLVVAIVGATFAFFTAQAGQGNVEAEAYVFDTDLTINETSAAADKTGLIPMAGSLLSTATTQEDVCVDKNGYDVCQVYTVVFTNNADQDVTLTPALTVTTNGFTNLKMVYAETLANASADGATTLGEPNPDESVTFADITVPANGTKTVYYVVYLEEAEEANEAEQGQKFTGTMVFTDAAGGNKLTGTFA